MAYTFDQLTILKTEIETSPAGIDYSSLGSDHVAIAERFNSAPRTVPNDTEVSTWQIFGKIDQGDLATVVANEVKYRVLSMILSMGAVNPADQNIRNALLFVFDATATATRQSLAQLATRNGRRPEELGLPDATPSDVAHAMNLP